jgi:acylphosphatase
MKRAHIFVSGMVHGVGYRSYARNHAKDLGLKGFVKNLRDGRVEIVAEGYDKQLQAFLQLLRKGSWGAKVKDIEIDWEEPTNEYADFAVEA